MRILFITPYPNTPTYVRLSSEGRMISTDWNH